MVPSSLGPGRGILEGTGPFRDPKGGPTVSTASHPPVETLPLFAGQRLDRVEFHERYEAMPPHIKAELIDGVVYMPSPIGDEHAIHTVPAIVWLSYYEENTPGVRCADNGSIALGPRTEVQPDAALRILTEFGGRTRVEKILFGAPELIVEVSHTTKRTDLGAKLAEYERAGVLEYVVRTIEPDGVLWHVLREGKLVAVPPDADGIHRSAAFAGLWLEPAALLARDLRRVRAVVDLGVATDEHAAFGAELAARRA